MSGSSDYTTTPNLGLFMPNYDMDDGTWGTHLNANASVLDSAVHALQGSTAGGPFLPLSGGTVSGNVEAMRGSFGTQGGSPALFDGTLPLSVHNNPTFSGGGWGQSLITNSVGAGTTTLAGQPQWNLFLTNDSVQATAADSVANVASYYTCTGTHGSRISHQVSLLVKNTTDAPGNSEFHQGLSCSVVADGTLGGTSGNYGGNLFGSNITAQVTANGKYLVGVCGLEVDVALQAGSSAVYKSGIASVLQGGDAVDASTPSYAFGVGLNGNDSPSSPGFGHGLVFGGPTGWWPMNPTTGIMIYADPLAVSGGPAHTAATGIDFTAVTFSSAFLKSHGFTVDGSGHVSPLLANATNDAAAATAGVPIGALYRNGNAVQVRLV